MEDQEDKQHHPAAWGEGNCADHTIDSSRRKFAGAGLGVSAIFTLASRPVLAQVCNTPSGAAGSGNLSQHSTTLACDGKPPTYWSAQPDDDILLKKFHDVFKKAGGVDYAADKMKWVMRKVYDPTTSKKPQPLCAEFAAAWVNIKKSRVPASVLSETDLIVMWNQLLANGEYIPTTGAKGWLPDQVICYLRTLYGIKCDLL
jgi:hypothetical protein